MAIPGNWLKAVNGNGPNLREGIGGSIKAVGGGRGSFEVTGAINNFVTSEMVFRSTVMFSDRAYKLSGVTKDSNSAILGACVVSLYYAASETWVCNVLSDATTGAYSFSIGPNLSCFIVAYKAGSPDVAGTTVNTLIAS